METGENNTENLYAIGLYSELAWLLYECINTMNAILLRVFASSNE
jgi:hypothetical protein